MLLSDLCSYLGTQSQWCGLKRTDAGLREVRTENPDYEIPEVRLIEPRGALEPSVLLITAPAAVGKSTAAQYMSHVLRAPIQDLAALQVGSGTLSGRVSDALGMREAADFFDAVTAGEATLIIDALDEAEVRSGQANFRAFILDLTQRAAEVTGGPSFVVFSRAESSRGLRETFAENKLPYLHYEIQPFTEDQAKSYLDRRICQVFGKLGKEFTHHKHIRPYEEARDRLFATLASAVDPTGKLWENAAVRDLLGYAPVLDVVAEYLAVDNFATVTKDLSSSVGDDFAHWNIVAEVIDKLLHREQGKFVAQFKETPGFRQHGSEALLPNLYSPEEQCARLLDYVEGFALPLEVPAVLPVGMRDAYEESVEAQLINHPFLRNDAWFNVIFRDYVTARSLNSPITSGAAAQTIRTQILSSAWKHSPMYGYFSYSLGRAAGAAVSSCHSEEIGALYESFKSMCEAKDDLVVAVGREGDRLLATFAVSRADGTEGTNDADGADVKVILGPLAFASHPGTKSVTFPRELSRANIWDVPEVILGGDQRSFKFGAHVSVSCGELMVASSDVRVFPGEEEVPVTLRVSALVSDHVKVQADADDLIIMSDELAYPWSKYQRKVEVRTEDNDSWETDQLYLEFRRIVLRFKDAKNGEAAVYQPMMDNLVIGTNQRARYVLDFLQHIGCVSLSTKSMYLLDFGEFSRLNISRSQLRDLEKTPAAAEIAQRLLGYAKDRRSGGSPR
ncbi:hypothetical protein [Streptomyces hiroshimensis]|uniref:AAA+ ATPase domain-containing protein n=1 Tax=Streptomyces hiroshimensis TaxID=66424 RepID=A0ABQ2Y7L5_9ACTN|nr:hypothetical protein [Streptomyces hiroshimensis]GGX72655.1 hypothetical protein GCM10010324_17520 [Streptomyces hiroshimensis]